MSQKNSAQNIIQSYRKKQQMGPYMIRGLAVLLVIIGVAIIAVWLLGGNRSKLALFASATPTATTTFTPTATVPTPTASTTPTVTATPTLAATATRSGPTQYTVVEDDNCYDIATKFGVSLDVLLVMNNFPAGTCPIKVGDVIWIPTTDQQLPTATDVPASYHGEITYTIQTGDTLASIAEKFLTTVDDIISRNDLTDENTIYVGEQLKIKPNIATKVPTQAPTSTSAPVLIGTSPAATTAVSATATATTKP